MKKQNSIVNATGQQQVVLRDWNPEIVCITIVFLVVFILTVGTPDIIDGLVARLMK